MYTHDDYYECLFTIAFYNNHNNNNKRMIFGAYVYIALEKIFAVAVSRCQCCRCFCYGSHSYSTCTSYVFALHPISAYGCFYCPFLYGSLYVCVCVCASFSTCCVFYVETFCLFHFSCVRSIHSHTYTHTQHT